MKMGWDLPSKSLGKRFLFKWHGVVHLEGLTYNSNYLNIYIFFQLSVNGSTNQRAENVNELDGTSELKNSRKRNAIIPEGVTIMSRNKKPRVSLNERISSILGDPIDESETSQEISDESIQEISSHLELS